MGFFQLFIDRHLDSETIQGAIRHYFGPDRTITYFGSHDDKCESWVAGGDKPGDVEVVITPLSETYPLRIDIRQAGPDSLEEERRFALHFSKAANCRSIITDEELNPYSWTCVEPSGAIETVYLTDADMGVEDE